MWESVEKDPEIRIATPVRELARNDRRTRLMTLTLDPALTWM